MTLVAQYGLAYNASTLIGLGSYSESIVTAHVQTYENKHMIYLAAFVNDCHYEIGCCYVTHETCRHCALGGSAW